MPFQLQPLNLLEQERTLVASDLAEQQDLNNRTQRDVERFKNREQLLAKVCTEQPVCPFT